MVEKLFSIENIEEVKQEIKEGLNFPYIHLYHSTLGGNENISMLLTISLNSRETWANQILENSAYIKLHILNNGQVYMIVRNREVKKFRKIRFKNIKELVAKLNAKIILINS